MSEIHFKSEEHRRFYFEMLDRCRVDDCYHRAFFYVAGVSAETRAHIDSLFDFAQDQIRRSERYRFPCLRLLWKS